MSAPNLHVALAMALRRPTSDSDAALIAAVYRLAGGPASRDSASSFDEPVHGQMDALVLLEEAS